MRIKSLHAQGERRNRPVGIGDYITLFRLVVEAKLRHCRSLTVYLPLELQHPRQYHKVVQGWMFVEYGEWLKRFLHIKLYWGNAPLLNEETKGLANGQTKWHLVPGKIDLCLDTGHLMLGAISASEARERIRNLLRMRGSQVKHIHINENDFKKDLHHCPGKVITPQLLEALTRRKTYIYE